MDSDKLRRWWLVGALVIVALAINVFFWERGAQRQRQAEQNEVAQKATQDAAMAAEKATREAAIAAEKAIQYAAAERGTFLNRYVNTGFARMSGTRIAALVVASENRLSNDAIRAAIAGHLQTNSIKIVSSFFTPAFVSDGFFTEVFDGSREPVNKLELTHVLDEVVLAQQSVQYWTNDASLNHVITAEMQLDVLAVPLAPTDEDQKWTFASKGAGFTPEDARSLAEERLVKQITTATNFYLNQ